MNWSIRNICISSALALTPTLAPAFGQSAEPQIDTSRWMLNADRQDDVAELLKQWSDESTSAAESTPAFKKLKKQVYNRIGAGNGVAQISRANGLLMWMEFSNIYVEGRRAPLIDLSGKLDPPYLMNGFQLSPDGRHVLVDVSANGGEIGTSYICDAKTGAFLFTLEDSEMSSSSWLDEHHLLISKPVDGADDAFTVSQHVFDIRTGDTGPAIFGHGYSGLELKDGAYPSVWGGASKSQFVLAYEWRGDNFRVFYSPKSALIEGKPDWTIISESSDITDAELFGDTLLLLDTSSDGQQAVYRQDLLEPAGEPQLLVPSSDDFSPQFVLAASDAAYLLGRNGAFHRLLRILPDFKVEEVDLPMKGSILAESIGTLIGGGVAFEMSSPADRSAWIIAGDRVDVLLRDAQNAQTSDVEIIIERALSADGTEIPITIYNVKDTPLKGAPGLIEAYGSYGETQMVVWDILADIWLENGGVYALCHTRGGGYRGRPWHLAGKGPDKSAAHQDLIACAERLTELTGEPHVAALGGSAAGVVVGPAALMRPDLISAMVLMYSWLNPTEFWSDVNGPAQIDEMGDPTIPEDFEKMVRSDSLLLLEQTTSPPSAFICLGGHDTRVSAWHSARFIQRYKERFPEANLFVRYNEIAGHACSFGGDDLSSLIASQYLWLRSALSAPHN